MRGPRERSAPASSRVVASLSAGGLIGVAVALLLQAAIRRTATPLPVDRAFWQLLLLGFSGALAGFALSAVSALQASNPDPDYHQTRRRLRPSGRPPGAGQ